MLRHPLFSCAPRALMSLLTVLSLAACATVHPQPMSPAAEAPASSIDFISSDADPLRSFNEVMYEFNQGLDRVALKPAATAYQHVTPVPLRRGVTNFFKNLGLTSAMLNDVLQGRLKRFAKDAGRFVVNSTVGVLGLVDVATPLGLRAHHQDFGMTLAKWGVHSGPYLVLPFFGPSDARDAVGLGADWYATPTTYVAHRDARWTLWGLDTVNTRAQYLSAGSILQQAAGGDGYDFVREAYRQRRQYQLSAGQPAPPAPPFP